jgi:hypothetical protein
MKRTPNQNGSTPQVMPSTAEDGDWKCRNVLQPQDVARSILAFAV